MPELELFPSVARMQVPLAEALGWSLFPSRTSTLLLGRPKKIPSGGGVAPRDSGRNAPGWICESPTHPKGPAALAPPKEKIQPPFSFSPHAAQLSVVRDF